MYIYYLLSVCTSFEKHKITKESVSINSYQTYVGFIRAGLLVFDMFYARTEQVKIVTRYLQFYTSSWSCRVFTGVTLVAPQHFSFTSAVTSEYIESLLLTNHFSSVSCRCEMEAVPGGIWYSASTEVLHVSQAKHTRNKSWHHRTEVIPYPPPALWCNSCSVPNSSDGLIFVKRRALDGPFLGKNTGFRRAHRRAKFTF